METIFIELFYALEAMDLEKTKNCIDILNNMSYDRNITKFLELNKIINGNLNNNCYDYLLLNLKNIDNREFIRWNRDINILLYSGRYSINDIENFIIKQLDKKSYNINTDEFINGLLKLAKNMDKDPETALRIISIIKERVK